jgi:hypothetical protein
MADPATPATGHPARRHSEPPTSLQTVCTAMACMYSRSAEGGSAVAAAEEAHRQLGLGLGAGHPDIRLRDRARGRRVPGHLP